MNPHSKTATSRLITGAANFIIAFTLVAVLFVETGNAYTQGRRGFHIGYGISVGPHLDSRSDLLDQMGLDWVKVYDTTQLEDYPNQNVLYRTDVRGYPSDIVAWERGMVDLARELDAAGVEAIEIGNESNWNVEWGGAPPNPREFTDVLCRGYRAIKSVAPRIVVVSGGIAPAASTADGSIMNDMQFIREMLQAGAGRCFDAFGYHPYGWNQPPEADPNVHEWSFRRTERVYRLLASYGVNKQIWITEFGWVRDPSEEGRSCDKHPEFQNFTWMKFPAELQAAYTARAFQFAERNWPFVGPMFLWNLNWNLYDGGYENPCSHLRWYGILDSGGNPLPVFYAVANIPKYRPVQLAPVVGAISHDMVRIIEAGCTERVRLGSFTVVNTGYPGEMTVEVEAPNATGLPLVWTSVAQAVAGDEVEVFVDAHNVNPGIHLIAVNLRSRNELGFSSYVVRGWLLAHYPSSSACLFSLTR